MILQMLYKFLFWMRDVTGDDNLFRTKWTQRESRAFGQLARDPAKLKEFLDNKESVSDLVFELHKKDMQRTLLGLQQWIRWRISVLKHAVLAFGRPFCVYGKAVRVPYDAAAKAIVVSGGTERHPATFQDVRDAAAKGLIPASVTGGVLVMESGVTLRVGDGSRATHLELFGAAVEWHESV